MKQEAAQETGNPGPSGPGACQYLEAVRARKAALGLADTPESVEAMRNKGGNRTPAKRVLLRRAARRAKAAGKTQVTSCF